MLYINLKLGYRGRRLVDITNTTLQDQWYANKWAGPLCSG